MNTELAPHSPADARDFFAAKMAFTTGPVELSRVLGLPHINVVDVRAEEDYAKGHVPGAVNLPQARWGTFEGLDKTKTNVLLCYSQVCHLAALAAVEFASVGYPVMELDGGFEGWKANKLPVEKQ